MLTYLINVTDDLLAVAVVIGIIFSFTDHFSGRAGWLIPRILVLLGVIAAGVRAYITNTRRLTGGWKVGAWGYGIALGLFLLLIIIFAVFSHWFFRKKSSGKAGKASEIIISTAAGALAAADLYCALPNVLVYPFKFDTGGNGFLSTDFLFRLGGYLLGLIICFVSLAAAYHISKLLAEKGKGKALVAAFLIVNTLLSVNHFARLMSVLTPRKIIDSTTLFQFAAWSNNHSYLYTWCVFAILTVMAVSIFVLSRTMKEPYNTRAERRKQRAVWRSGKRYSAVMLVCFILGILCATLFVKLNEVVIREAPVETPELVKSGTGEDSELRVSLELVSDGHLHRFGYNTADGYPTRFIVVLKQENTSNYGIGLDACEICGEAGYYENSEGQIVCKKCQVVMNRSTIGMKGGCNPIIIDYDIQDGTIIIPVEEMVKNQSRFTK